MFSQLSRKPAGLEAIVGETRPVIRYWLETEVHVYALSVAASTLLAFFPFLIVMVSLFRYVFEWPAAVDAIYLALRDYFPDEIGAFLVRNLKATVASRGPVQLTSIFLLLFTANGVFVPFEVALNRAWGVTENRSYWKNQIVSLGMIFACGSLALLSFIFTALNQPVLAELFGRDASASRLVSAIFFKAAAMPLSILALLLMYWLLPNRTVPVSRVWRTSIIIGCSLEFLKYINLLTWPLLKEKLSKEYGPFYISVSIVLWSFLAAMLILAGADWSARRARADSLTYE